MTIASAPASTPSRRSFIKAGAVGTAAAAVVLSAQAASAVAGETNPDEAVAAEDWRTKPEPVAAEAVSQTLECDVLVIGLSYAGSAALRAATEAGVKVVAMEAQTEEDYRCIGAGHFGHINSQFLAERGVPAVDVVEFFNQWQLRAANRTNPDLCMKYAQKVGEAFDWYIEPLSQEERDSLDIQFYPTAEEYTTYKNGIATYVGTASTSPVQAALLQGLRDAATSQGAQILWGTSARQLTQDESGRVTGAVGQATDGSYVQVVATKGVVVCAGDYSGDPVMARELLPQVSALLEEGGEIVSMAGYQGDGLKLCYWAGGRLDPYQSTMGGDYYYPCDFPTDPVGSSAALWLNADGLRYCNEGFGFMEWAAYAGALQPQGKICTVFDSNVETQIKAQAPCHMGVDYPNGAMDGLAASLDAAVAGGPEGDGGNPCIYAADDYETLGGYLGYEGEALENFVASIERYNEMCAAGVDTDYGKDPVLLFPVKEPPFYAYAGEKTLGSMLCNTSGVAVDGNGQVLGKDWRPIPGLFAAGNTAGSRFGIQYTTIFCGASISFAVTQGKFTAEYVASL